MANDGQRKKKSKKKKKAHDKEDMTMGSLGTTDSKENTVMKCGEENMNAMPLQRRTLSNGLTIEELANGPPDGKVATPGKTVYF